MAVNGRCISNYELDESSSACICPENKPFNTGSKCVSCYLVNYWSNDENQCKSCDDGMYYNWRNKDCEYCPIDKPVVIGY